MKFVWQIHKQGVGVGGPTPSQRSQLHLRQEGASLANAASASASDCNTGLSSSSTNVEAFLSLRSSSYHGGLNNEQRLLSLEAVSNNSNSRLLRHGGGTCQQPQYTQFLHNQGKPYHTSTQSLLSHTPTELLPQPQSSLLGGSSTVVGSAHSSTVLREHRGRDRVGDLRGCSSWQQDSSEDGLQWHWPPPAFRLPPDPCETPTQPPPNLLKVSCTALIFNG